MLTNDIAMASFAQRNDKQVINRKGLETPIGPMIVAATEQGICLLEFTERKILQNQFCALEKLLNAEVIEGDNSHFAKLEMQLAEYFNGKRSNFDVPLVMPGTTFQQTVWKKLQKIPAGTTRSYQQLAISIKKPSAVRAVGHANGMNRISILIPCHRLVGSSGNLTGYGGGLWRKKWLLELEADVKKSKRRS